MTIRFVALVIALVTGVSTPARAEGTFGLLFGRDFGGTAGCPNLSNCSNTNLNVGISFGVMGRVLGFEEEIGLAENIFGKSPELKSNLLTLMSNLVFAPKIGPFRPYALVGIGLVKTTASFAETDIVVTDNNNLGWNLGAGAVLFVGDHVGFRGDFRYITSVQDAQVFGILLSNSKINFARGSGGLLFSF